MLGIIFRGFYRTLPNNPYLHSILSIYNNMIFFFSFLSGNCIIYLIKLTYFVFIIKLHQTKCRSFIILWKFGKWNITIMPLVFYDIYSSLQNPIFLDPHKWWVVAHNNMLILFLVGLFCFLGLIYWKRWDNNLMK